MKRENKYSEFTRDEAWEIALVIAKAIKKGIDAYAVAHAFYKGGLHDDRIHALRVAGVTLPDWINNPDGRWQRWRFSAAEVAAEKAAGNEHPSNICREYEWRVRLNAAFVECGISPQGFEVFPGLLEEYKRLIEMSRNTQNAKKYARTKRARELRSKEPVSTAMQLQIDLAQCQARTESTVINALREQKLALEAKHGRQIEALMMRVRSLEIENANLKSGRHTEPTSRRGVSNRMALFRNTFQDQATVN